MNPMISTISAGALIKPVKVAATSVKFAMPGAGKYMLQLHRKHTSACIDSVSNAGVIYQTAGIEAVATQRFGPTVP